MGTLNGKGALVTGGSRGIGRAIVKRLAGDGASVVFSYVANTEAADRAAREVTAAGGRALAVRADQGSLADLGRLSARPRTGSTGWTAGSAARTCPPTAATCPEGGGFAARSGGPRASNLG